MLNLLPCYQSDQSVTTSLNQLPPRQPDHQRCSPVTGESHQLRTKVSWSASSAPIRLLHGSPRISFHQLQSIMPPCWSIFSTSLPSAWLLILLSNGRPFSTRMYSVSLSELLIVVISFTNVQSWLHIRLAWKIHSYCHRDIHQHAYMRCRNPQAL